jgi:hypothetical protein
VFQLRSNRRLTANNFDARSSGRSSSSSGIRPIHR